jgi:hypothetical protein
MEPAHRASTHATGARWLHEIERRRDPADLRYRVAGVAMSLATGPHRVQEHGWQQATSQRLDLVERWVDSADRAASVRVALAAGLAPLPWKSLNAADWFTKTPLDSLQRADRGLPEIGRRHSTGHVSAVQAPAGLSAPPDGGRVGLRVPSGRAGPRVGIRANRERGVLGPHDPSAVNPVRRVIDPYLTTASITSATPHQDDGPPPALDLDSLIAAGIPVVSAAAFARRVEAKSQRRSTLRRLVEGGDGRGGFTDASSCSTAGPPRSVRKTIERASRVWEAGPGGSQEDLPYATGGSSPCRPLRR